MCRIKMIETSVQARGDMMFPAHMATQLLYDHIWICKHQIRSLVLCPDNYHLQILHYKEKGLS